MLYTIVPVLATILSLTTASPLQARAVPAFPAGTSFDIILEDSGTSLADLKAAAGSVIDIDLFDNDAATIQALAQTKKVICYFSAGSREDWRPDNAQFTTADYGKAMGGLWKGENWINVKSDNVHKIMKARIELAKSKGCNAVDPDNVDGFDENQDGFGYAQSDYSAYVNYLAGVAKDNGLAIGLKNALDLIPDVLRNIQFAVNEQCHENKECASYKPLTAANLAVFNIEYGLNDCSEPANVNLTTIIKPEDQMLNTLGGQCKYH